MMPVMDGIELCSKVKHDVRVSHVPVILLTAKDTLESRSEGYEAGADSYLTKPFTGSMLRSRIRNLLESRRHLADLFGNALQDRKEQEVAESSFLAIDNDFVRKITDLIEENLSSENLDVTYLADHLQDTSRLHPLPEDEGSPGHFRQRVHPENPDAEGGRNACLRKLQRVGNLLGHRHQQPDLLPPVLQGGIRLFPFRIPEARPRRAAGVIQYFRTERNRYRIGNISRRPISISTMHVALRTAGMAA